VQSRRAAWSGCKAGSFTSTAFSKTNQLGITKSDFNSASWLLVAVQPEESGLLEISLATRHFSSFIFTTLRRAPVLHDFSMLQRTT